MIRSVPLISTDAEAGVIGEMVIAGVVTVRVTLAAPKTALTGTSGEVAVTGTAELGAAAGALYKPVLEMDPTVAISPPTVPFTFQMIEEGLNANWALAMN